MMAGQGVGNVESLAIGAKKKKPKKRDMLGEKAKAYVDEDEAVEEDEGEEAEAENDGDEAASGDEAVIKALQDELQSAFLAGMIVGKEEPESVPDFDDEMSAIEHEVMEAQEDEMGMDLDGDEGEGEEHGYASAPEKTEQKDGKVLKPSKKNPKVRRWQRITDALEKSKDMGKGPATKKSQLPMMNTAAAALVPGKSKIGDLKDALMAKLSRDPRRAHKYWMDKQSWAVERMAKKAGVEPEVAARALSKVYAYHLGKGLSKGTAHKAAIQEVLVGKKEEGEK
jgi:hypothetical protein